MRKVFVSGRLAANAEIKVTTTGTQVVEFRIGNNEYVGGNSNNETYWFRVVSFNANHAKLVPYLTKGKSVEVIGDLKANPYISNVSNKAEAGLEIIANDIMFDNNFSTKQDGTGQTTTAPLPPTQPQQTKKTSARNPTTGTVKPVTQPTTQAAPPEDDGTDDLPF